MANLLHLVRLCVRTLRLQVQDLGHVLASKDVMATADALLEAEPVKEGAHTLEWDVRVRGATEDQEEELLMLALASKLLADLKNRQLAGRA